MQSKVFLKCFIVMRQVPIRNLGVRSSFMGSNEQVDKTDAKNPIKLILIGSVSQTNFKIIFGSVTSIYIGDICCHFRSNYLLLTDVNK